MRPHVSDRLRALIGSTGAKSASLNALFKLVEALDRYQAASVLTLNAGVGLCGSCDALYRDHDGHPPCGHCRPLLDLEQRLLQELRAARKALEDAVP